mmetsp:Transcript_16161/g.47127  ORF Transcript_16161/g.47127 Transcript_16161/m.47127 type:complete len:216 (+) Transcript_16161:765-1412(+)
MGVRGDPVSPLGRVDIRARVRAAVPVLIADGLLPVDVWLAGCAFPPLASCTAPGVRGGGVAGGWRMPFSEPRTCTSLITGALWTARRSLSLASSMCPRPTPPPESPRRSCSRTSDHALCASMSTGFGPPAPPPPNAPSGTSSSPERLVGALRSAARESVASTPSWCWIFRAGLVRERSLREAPCSPPWTAARPGSPRVVLRPPHNVSSTRCRVRI